MSSSFHLHDHGEADVTPKLKPLSLDIGSTRVAGERGTLCQSILTHRPLSSSLLGLLYRILNISHRKELLRGLWVTEPQQPEAVNL